MIQGSWYVFVSKKTFFWIFFLDLKNHFLLSIKETFLISGHCAGGHHRHNAAQPHQRGSSLFGLYYVQPLMPTGLQHCSRGPSSRSLSSCPGLWTKCDQFRWNGGKIIGCGDPCAKRTASNRGRLGFPSFFGPF